VYGWMYEQKDGMSGWMNKWKDGLLERVRGTKEDSLRGKRVEEGELI